MLNSIERLSFAENGAKSHSDSATAVLDEFFPAAKRYFFLFKQGLRKTNLNFIELMALIRIHQKSNDLKKTTPLQFVSSSELHYFIKENISNTNINNNDDLIRLSDYICNHLSSKIILDPYGTSAIIYAPTTIEISLFDITVESGYIHSCGDLIFSDNTQFIKEEFAKEKLLIAINKLDEDERFLIVPYCHEDFSGQDRGESEFLKDGLDDVKIHISKSYFGEIPVHQFIINFVDENKELGAAAPANYKESRQRFSAQFPEKRMATFWLVSDHVLYDSDRSSVGNRCYICYRQRYKNDNLYHHYEENKPAWVSHTTLPHSLAGAMINVVRPWLPANNPVICDPFCGSGTIYLEAQRFPLMTCITSDQSPLAEKILHDNITFFRMSAADIRTLVDSLEAVKDRRADVRPKTVRAKGSDPTSRLQQVVNVIDEWTPLCNGDFLNLTTEAVERGFDQVGEKLSERILLYVALRASVRGRVMVDREAVDWADVFDRELDSLLGQMKNHVNSSHGETGSPDGAVTVEGSYSPVTLPPAPYERRLDLFGSGAFTLRPVQDLPKGAFDAIICDPPYGFNTETDRWSAEIFAREMIPALVESLRSTGGQIVLAAPRTSHSGRRIPLPLRSDYLTRSIIEYCETTGRSCWKPSSVVPDMLSGFVDPPYYWSAEKTLSRRILHFWIKPN